MVRSAIGTVVLLLLAVAGADARKSTTVPLRVDAPSETPADFALPVTGGVPFPRGALADPANVRLLAGEEEVPCQVVRTAVWPDGSVKWVRIDAVLALAAAERLRLEYGEGVRRAEVADGLRATTAGAGIRVKGPGLAAVFDAGSGGLSLTVGDRLVFGREAAHLVLETLRVSGPGARRGPSIVVRDPKAAPAHGDVVVEETKVELGGPVRVRILLRGHFRLEGFGTGLPERVLEVEPPERVPFSLRYDFVRGVPVVLGEHQIVFTGEPDRDLVTRWELALPGQGAGTTRTVLEPGWTVDRGPDGATVVSGATGRLCRAPLRDGLALIRAGWENRPCAVGGGGKDARVAFWPAEAGPWDLRRYAREWATGESGNRDRREDMERYARYAARGLAKSHAFALWFGGRGSEDETARALSGPALLVAPPGWYSASRAFGAFAPEDPEGERAELDAGVRRYLDWFRFHQDLFRWHGKLAYGFWQTRYGDIHRHDRWDRDYGRWGWSLGDGAGRIGHTLMLTYLRTLERRYLVAGDAWNRAVYDTSMVHTRTHLENATSTWWKVRGTNHRHNVQPFGGPYVGMRGSYPYGQRILWFLAGSGVIRDGLDLVTETALDYATVRPGAFGASGGPDGQAAGAIALLFGYETTGDAGFLDACRRLLLKGDLIPGRTGRPLSYAADFGLFLAAEEYLALTGDEELEERFRALADRALEEEDRTKFLTVLARAARTTGEAKYREALRSALDGLDFTGSLAELPVERWPGHGGPRRPPHRANVGRDLPYALAALRGTGSPDRWPEPVPDPVVRPADVPEDWFRPGGRATRRDRVPRASRVLASKRAPDPPYRTHVVLARRDGHGNWIRAGEREADGITVDDVKVMGRAAKRVAVAVTPRKREAVAAFGFRVPLPLGTDPARIQVTVAGRFRTERWRLAMDDERIPDWLNSDSRTRWPRWRGGGLVLGPAGSYRIYRLAAPDTSPLFVDQGFGAPGWLDVTDRSGEERFGMTVRLLGGPDEVADGHSRAVRVDAPNRCLVVDLRSAAGPPAPAGAGPLVGAADVILHDGWRPPLGPPDLTREQFGRFLDDLDYGGNIGLFALRFNLATDHRVPPGPWKQRLADTGVEPRELLLSMRWHGALEAHAKRIGVRYDPKRPDASVERILDHYRRRR